MPGPRLTQQEKDEIVRLHAQGLSRYSISLQVRAAYPTVTRILNERGQTAADFRSRRGPDHPNYRDGTYKHAEGYVKQWVPEDDPMRVMGDARGYILVHRLVMARSLGRPLFPYERVHHRNGVRDDNRIENLELWEESHPPGQRAHEVTRAHCPTCTCMEEAA